MLYFLHHSLALLRPSLLLTDSAAGFTQHNTSYRSLSPSLYLAHQTFHMPSRWLLPRMQPHLSGVAIDIEHPVCNFFVSHPPERSLITRARFYAGESCIARCGRFCPPIISTLTPPFRWSTCGASLAKYAEIITKGELRSHKIGGGNLTKS